jgi:hypothetical protein
METGLAGAGVLTTLDQASEMVDVAAVPPVSKKRSGRPVVGGKGESWDALLKCLVATAPTKTKNGLPGVPYALKSMVSALKNVWHAYVPGVDPEVAPDSWVWIATQADAIINAILEDSYCLAADAYLKALAETVAILRTRSSTEHVTNEQAPVAHYTPDVEAKYRTAVETSVLRPMVPVYNFRKHGLVYDDLVALHKYIRELRKEAATPPDAVRLLTWTDLALVFMVPSRLTGRAAYMAAQYPDLVNQLVMWKEGEPAGVASLTRFAITPNGAVWDPKTRTLVDFPVNEDAELQALLTWAFAQRTDAKHLQRFLPRRLTVDALLRRLSKTVLATAVAGRVLTQTHIHTAVVSAAFVDALGAIDAAMSRLDAAGLDPIALLASAVYPSSLTEQARVVMPEVRAASAESLTGVKLEAPPT